MLAIVGLLVVVIGGSIFLAAMRRLSVDNDGLRIPYWAFARRSSVTSVLGRTVGAAVVVAGSLALAPVIGSWNFLVLLLAMVPGLMVIPTHNHHLQAARR